MILAHRWRGDAFLWHRMTRAERVELIALDRYASSGGKKKADRTTDTMSKAERIAEFQRRLKRYREKEHG